VDHLRSNLPGPLGSKCKRSRSGGRRAGGISRSGVPIEAGDVARADSDAASTRFPRSKSDRGELRDQPRAEEPALRSGRIRQSCGDRAVFGSRKRAVLREHRAPRAFAGGPRGPRSRGRRKDLSGRLWRRRDAGPRLLHRMPSTRWPLGSSIPAPSGSIGPLELLTRLSQGINHGFHYRRREAKGIQLPVETLRLGHGSCRDFAMLMIEAASCSADPADIDSLTLIRWFMTARPETSSCLQSGWRRLRRLC
jgi:hypothetical protein